MRPWVALLLGILMQGLSLDSGQGPCRLTMDTSDTRGVLLDAALRNFVQHDRWSLPRKGVPYDPVHSLVHFASGVSTRLFGKDVACLSPDVDSCLLEICEQVLAVQPSPVASQRKLLWLTETEGLSRLINAFPNYPYDSQEFNWSTFLGESFSQWQFLRSAANESQCLTVEQGCDLGTGSCGFDYAPCPRAGSVTQDNFFRTVDRMIWRVSDQLELYGITHKACAGVQGLQGSLSKPHTVVLGECSQTKGYTWELDYAWKIKFRKGDYDSQDYGCLRPTPSARLTKSSCRRNDPSLSHVGVSLYYLFQ